MHEEAVDEEAKPAVVPDQDDGKGQEEHDDGTLRGRHHDARDDDRGHQGPDDARRAFAFHSHPGERQAHRQGKAQIHERARIGVVDIGRKKGLRGLGGIFDPINGGRRRRFVEQAQQGHRRTEERQEGKEAAPGGALAGTNGGHEGQENQGEFDHDPDTSRSHDGARRPGEKRSLESDKLPRLTVVIMRSVRDHEPAKEQKNSRRDPKDHGEVSQGAATRQQEETKHRANAGGPGCHRAHRKDLVRFEEDVVLRDDDIPFLDDVLG